MELTRVITFEYGTKKTRGRRLLHGKFREGSPKSIVVSENIDAVPEVITHNRHVTYSEIRAYLALRVRSIIYKRFVGVGSHIIS